MAPGNSEVNSWLFLSDTLKIQNWTGQFLKAGKKITTVMFYLRNVYQFLQYFKDTPPQRSRMSKSQVIGSIRMVRSCVRHMQAKVTIHQMSVKSAKEKRAISQEVLAEGKNPTASGFYGFFSAFVNSIYGHSTGVLTNMTIQEVNEARKKSGPDASGFVISIAEHKTNKAFGYAQIYLDPTEFSWLERWIELRAQLNPKSNLVFISGSKTPAKNMVKYLQLVWAEMGLPGRPTFIDIRSAVATHNIHPPEIRSRLSAMMCHDTATVDKFYVRHLNMEQSHEIRRLFEEATHGASGPAPSSTSLPEPRVPAKPRSDKRKRRVSVSESSSSEEAEVPYQESGSSTLEEEMEEITRAKRRLAKKREGDGKEEEDDDDDDEQEQGEKDQQEEEEDQQQKEEEQQEEEDLKKTAKATQSEGTKRKALYEKVVVTLSPLKSQLITANKASSRARRALLRAERRRTIPYFNSSDIALCK
ncbi:hypothetical protein ATANTOWER_025074 [Ataeniobius toweri]|uniref:Uncharacterized protein n=1 Tax=Ataeniobius toweri TaxID=208326 RepID=A0ABU7BUF0_9TELE|nr:hypothetical protein [Ataeniobius toweri]